MHVAQLSNTSSVDSDATNSESDSDDDEQEVESLEEQTRIKWEFRDETWGNPNFEYNPKPTAFQGNRMEP